MKIKTALAASLFVLILAFTGLATAPEALSFSSEI